MAREVFAHSYFQYRTLGKRMNHQAPPSSGNDDGRPPSLFAGEVKSSSTRGGAPEPEGGLTGSRYEDAEEEDEERTAGVGPPVVGEDRGRPAVLVDGVVQSVAPDAGWHGYWGAMVPEFRPRRALLLGLGAGTIPRLLCERFGDVPVVAVEHDPAMIDLAASAFGEMPPSVDVVLGDAFAYVTGNRERFDLVLVDLYQAAAMPAQAFHKPFLMHIKRMAAPKGRVVFNLARDRTTARRVARLALHFRIEREVIIGLNVIIHARVG